MAVKRSLPNAQ